MRWSRSGVYRSNVNRNTALLLHFLETGLLYLDRSTQRGASAPHFFTGEPDASAHSL